MSLELALFLGGLRQFVIAESSSQQRNIERVWAHPLPQRVEEGLCITHGRIVRFTPERTLVLRLPANDSRFREGDWVRLSLGNPHEPVAEGMLLQVDDEMVEVNISQKSASTLASDSAADSWQLDVSFLDLSDFFLQALEDLSGSEVGRERILPLLTGAARSKLDLETYEQAEAEAKKRGFDDPQTQAVASALATDLSDLCWLIHGPPGTGKTRVLAWIIKELLQRGERVLVTSANYRTINLLLEAVAELVGDRRQIFKITPFIHPQCAIPQYGSFKEIGVERTAESFVIGATPFALRTRRLRGVDFDTVVIDEASQVSVALAVMAMLAGQQYVFASDHWQLPPVTLSIEAEQAFQHCIFGSLIGRGMDTMLETTHRLNELLCLWPSEQFYNSRLHPSPTAAKRRFTLAKINQGDAEILSAEEAVVWVAVEHFGCRSQSDEEIEALAQILLVLRESGLAWSDVGVVVPFRRQACLLRQRLDEELTVWATLPEPSAAARPDFLLLWKKESVFVVAVSGAGLSSVEEAAGLSLFSPAGSLPGDAEIARLHNFLDETLSARNLLPEKIKIQQWVFFPRVPEAALAQLPSVSRPAEVRWLGRQHCQPERLGMFLRSQVSQALDSSVVTALRAVFQPESVITASFIRARKIERNLQASLTPWLLDFPQEQWLKTRLSLPAEATYEELTAMVAEDAAEGVAASLITGVTGSGKSLVLLLRACTQGRLAPATRSLVLTHNRALKIELEARFTELGGVKHVIWHTFYSWLCSMLRTAGGFPEMLQYSAGDRLIAQCAATIWGSLSSGQIEFLREEIDWMQDRDVTTEESYLPSTLSGGRKGIPQRFRTDGRIYYGSPR